MKKHLIFLTLFILTIKTVCSQVRGKSILYDLVAAKKQSSLPTLFKIFQVSEQELLGSSNRVVSDKQILVLQRSTSLELFKSAPELVSLSIPSHMPAQLELVKEAIVDGNSFSFCVFDTSGAAKKRGFADGIHYRGHIKGDSTSIAAFSVFPNGDVMVLFSSNQGNINIGKLGREGNSYILYNSLHASIPSGFDCKIRHGIPDDKNNNQMRLNVPSTTQSDPILCKKIRLYWEVEYKLYNNNFGADLTATYNYLTGLFNQVAIMFLNEGIRVELPSLYVWTVPAGYNTANADDALTSFENRWRATGNDFQGDLAMLIDGSPTNNGGIAYLLANNVCNRTFAYSYANVYGAYEMVPTYSWDVFVVTHELGHQLGSHHTQWCGWNSGPSSSCGAIDDCVAVEPVNACQTCPATNNTNSGTLPGFSGSVMSYCHTRNGIGVNLANGFGPLPQNAIRATVANSTCGVSENIWTGNVNSAWEHPGNWSCNNIPTATTDVVIPSGLANYPVISSAAVCRRITQQTGSNLFVVAGHKLTIEGNTSW